MTNEQQQADESIAGNNGPLIFAFEISPSGSAEALSWDSIVGAQKAVPDAWRWIHVNREHEEVKLWLQNSDSIEGWVADALLAEDTRPRIVKHSNGYLINLRGVNMNPGEVVEDMISIRIWATKSTVITARAQRVLAAEDLREKFIAGKPPASSGALIAFIAERLVARIGPVVALLEDRVDELEEHLLDDSNSVATSKSGISVFRRMALRLRRYIAPQREAIAGFLRDSEDFLSKEDRHSLSDTHDVIIRLSEDLDLIRERALLLQEQLTEKRAEAMNDRLFLLSIISAIFLPLGFVTGLFGVNVAGMPGTESPLAFALLCVVMVVFVLGIYLLFRLKRWL